MSASVFQILDQRFQHLVVPSAELEELYDGGRWTEGPVWFADHELLLFSDIPNQRLLRYVDGQGVSIRREPSHFMNGNTRDRQGRLVSCEHGGRRVIRTESDGSITTLADRFEGKRLNSPNDVVVKSDGTVWFTDPTYGIKSNYEGYRADPEQACRNVFRLDPATGELTSVVDDFAQPNGLAFSPDETLLYIADSARSHDPDAEPIIRVFDVIDGRRLANGRIFCRLDSGIPDGFRLDIYGNLWTSAGDGVHCFAADGTLIGKILVPQTVANLCFGGSRRNRLFITATRSLYAIYTATIGA